jgi:hypothetical protein
MTVGGRSAAMLTTVDQILSSGSNALLLFVLAQVATVEQFGIVALLVAIMMAYIGFNRGSIGTPVLLSSNLSKRDILVESGYAVTWTAVSSVGAVAIVCAVGAWTGQISMALAFAVVAPVVLVQDVVRFTPIACGKPLIAVASDGFWALFMLALFIANFGHPRISVEAAILLWGLTGFISCAVLIVFGSVKPHVHHLLAWWRTYSPARIRFGGAYALTALSTAGATLAVTAIVGAAVAAGLRGASTLFGPIGMLIMALPLAFVPHARRTAASAIEQWRLLTKTSLVTSALTVVSIGLLLVIPDSLGAAVLGDTWRPALAVAPFIGLEAVANCWMVSIYTFLGTQGRSRMMLRLRIFHVAFQLCSCIAAAVVFGTAVTVAVALAVSCWLTVLAGLAVVRYAVKGAMVRDEPSSGVAKSTASN